MAEPPRYPKSGDDTRWPERAERPTRKGWSRSTVWFVVAGVALVAVMVGLHLAGVAPH